MHSGGLELTQFTYSRHEDNLLHTTGATGCVLQQWYNSSQCSSRSTVVQVVVVADAVVACFRVSFFVSVSVTSTPYVSIRNT